jgi:CBS-domain-containing membrane protein
MLEPEVRLARAPLRVRDVMATHTHAFDESACADEVLHAMAHTRARHVPIVSHARRVVGIVDDVALLRWVTRHR